MAATLNENLSTMYIHDACSEMWEASRWNEDYRFHAPMAICNGIHVFAGDIIEYDIDDDGQTVEGLAKVMKFYISEVIIITYLC